MKNKDRIQILEARVAQLEQQIAVLQARPILAPQYVPTPAAPGVTTPYYQRLSPATCKVIEFPK